MRDADPHIPLSNEPTHWFYSLIVWSDVITAWHGKRETNHTAFGKEHTKQFDVRTNERGGHNKRTRTRNCSLYGISEGYALALRDDGVVVVVRVVDWWMDTLNTCFYFWFAIPTHHHEMPVIKLVN